MPKQKTISPAAELERLERQLKRDYESGMVSYIDSTLNQLGAHVTAHPEVITEGTSEEYLAGLNRQTKKIWRIEDPLD
jgi:hypothetical protein